jgi:hypothetical protein
MRKYIFLLLGLVWLITPAQAQIQKREINARRENQRLIAKEDYFINSLQLIDLPTGNIINGGYVSGSLLMFEEGGMLGRLSAGISDRAMFGISYGGDHILGDQIIKWNDAPSVHIAYRALDESAKWFSVVFGLDTQGYGKYWRESDYPDLKPEEIDPTKMPFKRYSYKSRGFYVVASKNYRARWTVGLHVGANYSLETSDKDRDPNVFTGIDWQLGRDLAIVSEYDFAFNGDKLPILRGSKGYLNAAVRWAFQPNMYIEFSGKNLLADNEGNRDYVRCLKMVYYTRTTGPSSRDIERKPTFWERIFGRRDR